MSDDLSELESLARRIERLSLYPHQASILIERLRKAEAERDEARAALARVEAAVAWLGDYADRRATVAWGTPYFNPFNQASSRGRVDGVDFALEKVRAALAGGDDRRRCDHCGAPLPHAGTSWREAGACVRAEGGDA